MEGYPSLVKGTVLKTVRSFAARGFEPHTFLIIKIKEIPMAAPNKYISGKWTKEQRDKAKQLLNSWLQTHQKGKDND